jgi:ribonuclease PH
LIVEIQATAEKAAFTEERMAELTALAKKGIAELVNLQKLTIL